MGLKDSWDNIKNIFSADNEDEYDEGYEDEYEDENANTTVNPTVAPAAPAAANSFRPSKSGGYNTAALRPTALKVVVVEPKSFDAAETITNNLRDMRPVVINFESTDPHDAARIVDFVSGATYALDGKLEKIGKDIFICAPNNVSVDYSDKSYTTVADNFTWKEPTL